jgi:hypothetical protein
MRIALTTIAVALLFAACGPAPATNKVNVDYAPGVDFNSYKTYAWATPTGDVTSSAFDTQVQNAVASQLAAKGFTKAASRADADMVVSAITTQKQKTEIQDDGWGWGQDFGGPDPHRYDDGTVVVSLADPKTKTLVWQGTADMVVEHTSFSPEDVQKAIAEMFTDYPPKKK